SFGASRQDVLSAPELERSFILPESQHDIVAQLTALPRPALSSPSSSGVVEISPSRANDVISISSGTDALSDRLAEMSVSPSTHSSAFASPDSFAWNAEPVDATSPGVNSSASDTSMASAGSSGQRKKRSPLTGLDPASYVRTPEEVARVRLAVA